MITIVCAGCGFDLSAAQFHVALVSVSPDKIEADFHFCRLPCIDIWRARKRCVDKMWDDYLTARAARHTVFGVAEGHIAAICPGISFPDHEARNAEFHRAALNIFPLRNEGAAND